MNEEIEVITKKAIKRDIVEAYWSNVDNTCADENVIIFEKRKILVRAIVDYIAGMTDGYALEEFEKLK